jgi:hypothetical protein
MIEGAGRTVRRVNPAQVRTREDLIGQLGELFRRDARGIQRLAHAAGLSPATLHGMISGDTNLPRPSTLEAFVKECGQDPAPWLAARAGYSVGTGRRHGTRPPARRDHRVPEDRGASFSASPT